LNVLARRFPDLVRFNKDTPNTTGLDSSVTSKGFFEHGGPELAEYALPGTQDLATNAVAALGGRNACLLAHHGLVAAGGSLAQAMKLAIEVEALCEIYLKALAVPEPIQEGINVDVRSPRNRGGVRGCGATDGGRGVGVGG
jgi:hypothetical protein